MYIRFIMYIHAYTGSYLYMYYIHKLSYIRYTYYKCTLIHHHHPWSSSSSSRRDVSTYCENNAQWTPTHIFFLDSFFFWFENNKFLMSKRTFHYQIWFFSVCFFVLFLFCEWGEYTPDFYIFDDEKAGVWEFSTWYETLYFLKYQITQFDYNTAFILIAVSYYCTRKMKSFIYRLSGTRGVLFFFFTSSVFQSFVMRNIV